MGSIISGYINQTLLNQIYLKDFVTTHSTILTLIYKTGYRIL